jgi:hypothetical protein
MEQLHFLDIQPLSFPVPEQGETIQAAFERFHAANPQVYSNLVALARQQKAFGRDHVGIGMLFEVLRWQHSLQTTGDDFLLNNNFRSRYARLIQQREPELAAMFNVRELRAA